MPHRLSLRPNGKHRKQRATDYSVTINGLMTRRSLLLTDAPNTLSKDLAAICLFVTGSKGMSAVQFNYTEARIDEVAYLNVEKRGDLPLIGQYYGNLKANYVPRDAEVNYAHAARQAYIALGIAMVAAAEQEVDCTPMEGFDPSKVDEILGLKERGLRSVVLLPLGYRDPTDDWLLNMPKVRKSRETMVTQVD